MNRGHLTSVFSGQLTSALTTGSVAFGAPSAVIAHNLGNLLRRPALPVAVKDWSLTRLQERLFQTGRWLICHARFLVLQQAASYLTGEPLSPDSRAYRATRVGPSIKGQLRTAT